MIFDCGAFPLNFEFVAWLVQAELLRRRRGLPPPLRIKFLNKDEADSRRSGWLDEVMRPLLPMLGAIEDDTIEGHTEPYWSVEHIEATIADAARQGEEVPLLRVVEDGLKNPIPFITITLREAEHWPHRNSNLDAWLKFAADLQHQGEKVIFIRDFARAKEPIAGFDYSPVAATNLKIRMTCYQVAKMNFFVSNGPAMLCFFSKAPYCTFMTHYAGAYGPQRPWAGKDQRMVYQLDTYENLLTAWKEMS
jgi:hypothetical protein